MNVQAYYRHARSIGDFKACDALRIARQAAELDKRAHVAPVPGAASWEVLPDGSAPIKLSFSIKVY